MGASAPRDRRLSVMLTAVLSSIAWGAASANEPQVNYALHCMGCHTPDGSGVEGRVPSMRDTLVPLSSIKDGRRYLVQVPGSSQSTLSDAELAEVLNWMIHNLSNVPPPPSLSAFTTQEVGAYRTQTLSQVRATRERLLQSAQASGEERRP
jgi:mono/diheme cytochrome c family protein